MNKKREDVVIQSTKDDKQSIIIAVVILVIIGTAILIWPGESIESRIAQAVASLVPFACAVFTWFDFKSESKEPVVTISTEVFQIPKDGFIPWRKVDKIEVAGGERRAYHGRASEYVAVVLKQRYVKTHKIYESSNISYSVDQIATIMNEFLAEYNTTNKGRNTTSKGRKRK